MLMFACINNKNIVYLFRESLVDANTRLCTGLFLYKHMHKTSNCLILFLIEVVQFFSIVLYYIVVSTVNIRILYMDFMFSLDPSIQSELSHSQITNIEGKLI